MQGIFLIVILKNFLKVIVLLIMNQKEMLDILKNLNCGYLDINIFLRGGKIIPYKIVMMLLLQMI